MTLHDLVQAMVDGAWMVAAADPTEPNPDRRRRGAHTRKTDRSHAFGPSCRDTQGSLARARRMLLSQTRDPKERRSHAH